MSNDETIESAVLASRMMATALTMILEHGVGIIVELEPDEDDPADFGGKFIVANINDRIIMTDVSNDDVNAGDIIRISNVDDYDIENVPETKKSLH